MKIACLQVRVYCPVECFTVVISSHGLPVQFDPQLGNLNYNLKRAQEILEQTVAAEFDLLVLPEMAFSGL